MRNDNTRDFDDEVSPAKSTALDVARPAHEQRAVVVTSSTFDNVPAKPCYGVVVDRCSAPGIETCAEGVDRASAA